MTELSRKESIVTVHRSEIPMYRHPLAKYASHFELRGLLFKANRCSPISRLSLIAEATRWNRYSGGDSDRLGLPRPHNII